MTKHGPLPAEGAQPYAALIDLVAARELVMSSGFATWWGLQVESVGYAEATVALPSAPHLLRPGGVLHGACYDVVADVAMWLAIASCVPAGAQAVTIEIKTNFLRPTAGDIRSTARLRKRGRRVAFGVADTVDAQGILLACTTLSYALG